MIPSEQQAEQVGAARTGGQKGKDFTVFQYTHKSSKLTLFGVEINATKETIFAA